MWIVRLALLRPYTFVVLALLILIGGAVSIFRTPTDIFPEIDIPVISVIWTYEGLSTEEFEKQMTVFAEFALSSNVNDVQRMESQTLDGVGIIKIFFHPGANIANALAQTTAISQTIVRRMPTGVNPPIILRYSANSVPIIQLSLTSDRLTESQLYDYGMYRMRTQLATINGITLPAPYGGRMRQIMIDIDPAKVQAAGLSGRDISTALNAQNLTLPSGTARFGDLQYRVRINNSFDTVDALNSIPLKSANGTTVFMRDVANVRDASEVQQNIVRSDGSRSVLIQVLKNGNASTLDIINSVKELLPSLRASAPEGMKIDLLFDQSLFVEAAVNGVVHEGVIAAALTATLILLFLGSWRSTLIIAISIPLSVLASLTALSLLGYTLNVMTLGGLALAIGILVDEATITIENIHRHLEMGKNLTRAIYDGSQEIALPALVSALAISIVFVPVVFLVGPAKFLFTPLALAVVFAILSSYILSRTLVPVLVKYLLRGEAGLHSHSHSKRVGWFRRIHLGFNAGFEATRSRYVGALRWSLHNRGTVFVIFAMVLGGTLLTLPWLGRDFFPTVDAGQFRLHVRAATGTRLERTEQVFSDVEQEIRRTIPADEVALILDNIGVVSNKFTLAFGDNATIGSGDGEILVALKPSRTHSTPVYVAAVRDALKKRFPELSFFFQPADIVSQILNFGLPAPINVKIVGSARADNYAIAQQLRDRIAKIPGAVDVYLHQALDAPELRVNIDRTRLAEVGLTQRDVASDLLVSLASSNAVQANFWVDPRAGQTYPVAVQTPPYRIGSMESLLNTPVASSRLTGGPELLGNIASVQRTRSAAVVNHYNIQNVYDVYAAVQGRDLGAVSDQIEKILKEVRPQLKPGNTLLLRGQVESMNSAFTRMGWGLIAAAVLVYFLMVVNFQSWTDPLIILTALPGAFAGIVWALYLTQTTLSVPSLMGSIMTVGVATANAILLVTFANSRLQAGADSITAALDAGATRLRPVIMTAGAMIVGMVPMALGLGEGGEQNAPLGRAVIGGLLLATLTTLLFVPVVFSIFRRHGAPAVAEDDESLFLNEPEPSRPVSRALP